MIADDTSIFTKSQDIIQSQSNLNSVIGEINEWLQNNQITLNLDKTFFYTLYKQKYRKLGIYKLRLKKNIYITTANEIKFLGLIIDNKLSWKGHIDYITTKLNSASYCMRAVKPFVSQDTLKIIYYSYFHSIMAYGLPFWGFSTESIKVFKLQKRAIRVMMGCKKQSIMQRIVYQIENTTIAFPVYSLFTYVS